MAPEAAPADDPASLVVLEVAAKVDQYVDYARFCDDLHQADKGRRYRELAGLHDAIPGEDDLCHFRYRVGAEAIDKTMAAVVELCRSFGLIKGELLSTDGQLEPSYARYKGCTYACQGCRSFRVDEAGQQELCRQLHSGAKRLQLTCPFPDVVDKVRQATAKQGNPRDPKVALLEIEDVPEGQASSPDRQQVATLLGLPEDERTGCAPHRVPLEPGAPGRAARELPQGALGPRGQGRLPHRYQGPLQDRACLWLPAPEDHRYQPRAGSGIAPGQLHLPGRRP